MLDCRGEKTPFLCVSLFLPLLPMPSLSLFFSLYIWPHPSHPLPHPLSLSLSLFSRPLSLFVLHHPLDSATVPLFSCSVSFFLVYFPFPLQPLFSLLLSPCSEWFITWACRHSPFLLLPLFSLLSTSCSEWFITWACHHVFPPSSFYLSSVSFHPLVQSGLLLEVVVTGLVLSFTLFFLLSEYVTFVIALLNVFSISPFGFMQI